MAVTSHHQWPQSCTWTHNKDYSQQPPSFFTLRLRERKYLSTPAGGGSLYCHSQRENRRLCYEKITSLNGWNQRYYSSMLKGPSVWFMFLCWCSDLLSWTASQRDSFLRQSAGSSTCAVSADKGWLVQNTPQKQEPRMSPTAPTLADNWLTALCIRSHTS